MVARAADEPHRVSSQLELLFDLTFVIAVAALAHHFAGAIGAGHALYQLIPFLLVFFSIWWAWVNFTWFASAFDTDDVVFRLLTLVQMAGVLVLAAGVPAALEGNDYRAVTSGYAIMRVGLVAHWLRAAYEDPSSRSTALRYAVGISVAQVLWLSRLWVAGARLLSDSALLAVFVVLVAFEMCIPFWSERRGPTSWHPHHIAERYGLFAIILLGEGVFAASTGVQAAVAADGFSASLAVVATAALILVFALWWLYFLHLAGDGLVAHRDRSYLWGYGHYGILVSLAAISAGLEIAVEQTGGHVRASPLVIGYAIAIPVAAFLVLIWALHAPLVPRPLLRPPLVSGSCAAILLLPLAAGPVALPVVVAAIAAVCALVVALTLALEGDRHAPATDPPHAAPRRARLSRAAGQG
jgi:low temperature requirement protein LtrA